ncbi:cell separation during budding [Clydaea vesicula]|uniref:Cell separation during budding n=1 Tax=Clydaea vesicula TaxID=447962 RepID=A0AAD5U256_9FUNG|nr:cell separation during budding [Clydaea vesicula]KAJ3385938.1 cell separation during budding [Lobulomyces angularis]
MVESYLTSLLSKTSCQELLQTSLTSTGHAAPKQPICLDSNLSVQEGCQALAQHRISSAPVYDASEGGFVGMLDFKDLVTYVLEVFHKVPKEKTSFDSELEVSDIVKKALQNNHGVHVKMITNLSKENPLVAVQTTSPLTDAINEFKRTKIHRLVVVEPTSEGSNRFIGVLSQSTIAAFIASKFGKMVQDKPPNGWPTGEKSVEELGLVTGGVISITQHETVLDALYVMHTNKVSSVAIIDRAQGYDQLLGNISMSDMKEIFGSRGGYKHLFTNSFKFFVNLRSNQGLEAGGNDRAPSFTIHPTTSLVSAIERMAATRSHRVWVVEGNDKLVGVLGLSDFVQFFE